MDFAFAYNFRGYTIYMIYRIRRFISSLSYRLSPREVISDLRFYWYSGDRGNSVFVSAILLLFLIIGLFIYQTIDNQYEAKELRCLSLNIYHEARGEPDRGKYAVASVTLNRVASKHYPGTICEVVFQKRWDYLRKRYVSAFSWTELDAPISTNTRAWQKAVRIARDVYHNPDTRNVRGALFYHARHIRPSWARKKVSVAKIGRHIFYH